MNYKNLLNNKIIIDDLSLIYKHHSNKKNFFNKTLMITGNNGFIGTYLSLYFIHYFKKLSIKKIIFIDTSNSTNLKNKNLIFLKQDVTKSKKIIYKYKPDIIIHAATFAYPVAYRKKPIETAMANVEGLKIILEYAKQKKIKILFFSTSEIYGNPDKKNIPTSENYNGNVSCVGPRACYDEGKRCAEALFFDYQRQHDLSIKIIRIFNTYGPRMLMNDGRVVSNFIVQALKGENITIYGEGQQTRSFCYVDDLVNGMISMMNSSSDFYGPVNLGNPNEFTMIELAEKVLKLTQSKSKIVFQSLPQDDPKQRRPDITKAKSILKWKPKINRESGLKITYEYFKSLPPAEWSRKPKEFTSRK